MYINGTDENKREKIYSVHEKFITQLKRMEPLMDGKIEKFL